MSTDIKPGLKWLGVALLAFTVVILLEPARNTWQAFYGALDDSAQLVVDLVGVGAIALIFAGLLAPLESLGWWAGWFGEPVKTATETTPKSTTASQQNIVRYVVYLDGIGQSSAQRYLPDIEDFLQTLAKALPNNMVLVRDVMSYSVIQQDLGSDARPLAFFWRLADRLRFKNPNDLIGFVVNIRNILKVSVSADQRYGPIYNRGLAQEIYNGLRRQGYRSGIPVTLIGYSGGGQVSTGAAGYLKEAIQAPINVISLGGVMSGNNHYLKLEHVHHFVGDLDNIQSLGSIMFPGRRRLLFLSHWNRARRLGKVTEVRLGPVGHNVPGGLLDPNHRLADGRMALQKTLEIVLDILNGIYKPPVTRQSLLPPAKQSNDDRYRQADFNRPDHYPVRPTYSSHYQPVGTWVGRLLLPPSDQRCQGVWFEVHHASPKHQHLVGQTVRLRMSQKPETQRYLHTVTKDIHFSEKVLESRQQGNVHPDRLNSWQQVNPLESLAGARPVDDVMVRLPEPVIIQDGWGDQKRGQTTLTPTLYIDQEPVQITGSFYGVVQIGRQVIPGSDLFEVHHLNPETQQFNGEFETLRIPQVRADQNGVFPSSHQRIEKSPLNEAGWYVYGAKDAQDRFVIQAIAPRSILRRQPDTVVLERQTALKYMHSKYWQGAKQQKGMAKSILFAPAFGSPEDAIADWQEGDRALVMHLYGGIGGKKKEFAPFGLFFGHFAYGVAQVIRDPLSQELRFEIQYKQVYTQNTDGIIAGTLSWSNYMGDRQRGWLGSRPVADVLIKFDPLTEPYDFDGLKVSALDDLLAALDIMTARYRIGDGTGGTFVGPTNSCVQDAHQAMYAAICRMEAAMATDPQMRDWLLKHPEHPQTQRLQRLVRLVEDLRQTLVPMGIVRSDWKDDAPVLGRATEENLFYLLYNTLTSWRSLLPRLAFDELNRIFLEHGASLWLLRTNQAGGFDPDIEPIVPTAFWW